MDVSLCVLNVCSAEYRQYDRPNDDDERSRRLECAVTVEQDLFRPVNFDTVQIALRGRLKTQINGRVSTTELNAHKRTLHWSDFYPLSPHKSTLKSRSQADLIFRLNNPQSAIPSLALELTTDITCDHALGNRHQAKGRADVDYWFEATFFSQSTKIFATAGAVHMPEPSALRLSPADTAQQLSFPATQRSSTSRILPFGKHSRSRRPPAGQQPHTLAVRLQSTSMSACASTATSALGTISKPETPFRSLRRSASESKDRAKLRIPFRVQVCSTASSTASNAPHTSTYTHPPKPAPIHEPIASLVQRGALCDITAKWFVTRTMSSADGGGKRKLQAKHGSAASVVSGVSRANTLSRCTVITQRERVVVPPFYELPVPYSHNQHHNRGEAGGRRGTGIETGQDVAAECCAEALLEVPLPASAIAPSVSMHGLGLAYEVELKMVFEGIEPKEDGEKEREKGGKSVGLGTVVLKIPVVLEGL